MHFEVTSVTLARSGCFRNPAETIGSTLRWTTQLAYLVEYAHPLLHRRKTTRKATEEKVRLILPSLLPDRFYYVRSYHDQGGRGLRVNTRDGPKVQEAKEGEIRDRANCSKSRGLCQYAGQARPIHLALALRQTGQQVIAHQTPKRHGRLALK